MSDSAQKLVKSVQLVGLLLESFKIHSTLAVQFSPSMTAIVGPNYSGKTAIEKAIFFALVGTSAVAGSKADLTKHGAKNCKVILTLSWGDDAVEVMRTPSTASVTVNGKLIASGLTAVTEFVAKMFGTDAKTLVALSRSSRGETSALLAWGAANLNRLIEDVYDVSAVDRLIERAGVIASKAELARAQLPSELEDFNDLDIQRMNKAFELNAAKTGLAEAKAFLANEEIHLANSKNLLSKVRASNQVTREATKEKDRLQGMLEECLQTLSKLQIEDALLGACQPEAKAAAEGERAALSKFKEDWHAKKYRIKLASDELKLTHEWFEKVYAPAKIKYDTDLPLYEVAIAEFNIKLAEQKEIGRSLGLLDLKLKTIRNAIKDCVCQECKRPYEQDQLAEAQSSESSILSDYTILEETRNIASKELLPLSARVRDLENSLPGEVLDAFPHRQEQLKRSEKVLFDLGSLPEYGNVDNRLDDLHNLISQLTEKQRAKNKSEVQLHQCLSRKSDIEAKLATVKETGQEVDTAPLELSLAEATKNASDYQQSVFKQNTLFWQYERELGELTKRLEALSTQTEAIKRLEYRAGRFKEVQSWLRKNKSTFLASYWDSLMAIASDFVFQATSGRVTKLIRDDSSDFMFEQDGKLQSVEGCASGAQQCIFGVAIRMALAELLPLGFGFIVLDEPSAELNDEHAAALAGALKASNRQVVLITHREGDQHSADSVISLGA